MEDVCLEETFRSLVELTFSLEPGSRYKTSLNALLCALCRVNPAHFSLLLASCEDVLISELDTMGHRLNTLAQASRSFHCTEVLLGSELVEKIVARLMNGFEKLLELVYLPLPHEAEGPSGDMEGLQETARSMASSLCCLLAFFTDFLQNWAPGMEWMATTDSHRFWSPMIEFLSMETAIISPLRASFIQEVAYEFFSTCLLGCDIAKRLFVQLLCNVLHNQFHSADAGGGVPSGEPVLTPYLHKLLVGLVFQHESIPVILKVVSSPEQDKGNSSNLISLPSTCESLEFHPSYPIGETCYYLRVSGSFSLPQLEALVKSHKTTTTKTVVLAKAEPKKPEKSLHKKLVPAKPSLAKIPLSKPPPPPTASEEDEFALEVENFKLKEWKLPTPNATTGSKKSVEQRSVGTLPYYCLDFGGAEDVENVYHHFLTSYAQHDERKAIRLDARFLCDIVPAARSSYPVMVLMDNKAMFFAAEHSAARDLDMYNMFASCEGLVPLARSVPPLYPYLWPASLSFGGSPPVVSGDPRKLFKSHTLLGPPTITPFRSVIMFGLCLQLESFGKVLGENTSAAYMLMRLLLGEDVGVQG